MKLIICTIYDSALDAYLTPWFAQTKGQAVRMFTDEINNDNSPMNKHPDDYSLYYIGTWDDQNAEIKLDTPDQLARGKNVCHKQTT